MKKSVGSSSNGDKTSEPTSVRSKDALTQRKREGLMKRKLYLVVGLLFMLFIVSLLVAGCGSASTTTASATTTSSAGTATTAPQSSTTAQTSAAPVSSSTSAGAAAEIKIGATLPMSGVGATFGKEAQQGAQLAVDQVNAAGGVNGSQIKLVVEDTAGNPATAVSALTKLVSVDKVVGLVCTLATGEVLAEAPVLTQHGIPLIVGPANAPTIPTASPFIFMPHPTSSSVTEVDLNYAYKMRHVQKLAVIAVDNEVDRIGASLAAQLYPSLGGQLVLTKLYPADTTDFKTMLTQVKGAGADGVLIVDAAKNISRCIQQAAELDLKVVWMSSSQIADASILSAVGKLADGAFYADPLPATDAGKKARADFVSAYTAKYGAPATVTPYLGYDDANMMLQAIKAVGTDGTKIKDYLTSLKGFVGATGEISFDGGNVAAMPTFIIELKDGKFAQTDFNMTSK